MLKGKQTMWRRMLATVLCATFAASVTACVEQEETSMEIAAASAAIVGSDTYLYFTCNATGWALNDESRLESTGAPELFALTYDVTAPWMVSGGDNCALIETNQYDGWGSEMTFYRLRNETLLTVPDGAQLQAGNYNQFAVRYPSLGSYTIQVNMAMGVLSIQGEANGTDIAVENLQAGDTVSYEMLIVEGTIPSGVDTVYVSNNGEPERAWATAEGRFTVIVDLDEGANDISVRTADGAPLSLPIEYVPRAEDKFVKVVYLTASDGTGAFQSPIPGEPSDAETAIRRLNLTAKLIQSGYAEMMNDAGLGRKTFQLMENPQGGVVFEEPFNKTAAQLQNYRLSCATGQDCKDGEDGYLSTYDLWGDINAQLSSDPAYANTIYLVYTAFTRYTRTTDTSLLIAGATLGGPNLGLAQGNSIYLMPENLDELQARIYDRRREADYDMNALGWAGDEFWQAYGTAVGGASHELGHALGMMNHADDYFALMSLGFTAYNRMFAPLDGDGYRYAEDEVPFLDDWIVLSSSSGFSCTDWLDNSAWFN